MQQYQPNDSLTDREGALVLFSGGQDSTTCLAWALDRFARVETIGFDYGQRNRVELECHPVLRQGLCNLNSSWAQRLGEDHLFDLKCLGAISETALTRDVAIKLGEDGVSNVFVPGRNLIFLNLAAAVAYRRGLRHIVIGAETTVPPIFPDCRGETIKALQIAINLGMDRDFVLHTPILHLEKAVVWRLALEMGGEPLVGLILEHIHTCYVAERRKRYPWGYGCGECPACKARAQGFVRFQRERHVTDAADRAAQPLVCPSGPLQAPLAAFPVDRVLA